MGLEDKLENHIRVAERAFQAYLNLTHEDRVLFVTDGKKHKLATIAQSAVLNLGAGVGTIVIGENTIEDEQAREIMQEYTVIFPVPPTYYQYAYYKYLPDSQVRIVNNVGVSENLFRPGGAMDEDPIEMNERLRKMADILGQSCGLRIKTNYGTDLMVPLKPFNERSWLISSGKISPGSSGNWPDGEVYITPDEEQVRGRLVLLDMITPNYHIVPVDKPITICFKNGLASSIQGGVYAKILRDGLKILCAEELKQEGDPTNIYRCAEIGFGGNSKARVYRRPLIEAEKTLGSFHIALGDATIINGTRKAAKHLDFVVRKKHLIVISYENLRDFRLNEQGVDVIRNGDFCF